jgi:N-acetylneuraminate synthase
MSDCVYIIAEAGVNHDGSVADAVRLVDAAAAAGADCVKFQTFRAEALASARAAKAAYQRDTTDAAESQQQMLKRLELSHEAHRFLIERARERDIDFLSTPFDPPSLDFLMRTLNLPRIKVGSGDLTNAPMLLEIAKAGKEVILSTGMADLAEVEEALSVLAFGYTAGDKQPSRAAFAAAWADRARRRALADKVVLLHCTTEYPAPVEAANLAAIGTLAKTFGLPVGYSDHTLGIEIAAAAVARGAVMIEKHLTLDRARPGPDHAASIDPTEFARMVESIRRIERALGDGVKAPQPAERPNIPIARKALVAARAIAIGEEFTRDNIAIKRPGTGRAPITFWETLGQKATRAYRADEEIDS